MAEYSTSDFINALLKKGFVQDNTHHTMFWYYLGERKTSVRTRTSQGEKKFGDGLLSERRKQIGLSSKKQMQDFIECPLEKEDMKRILVESGRVKSTDS